MNFELQFLYYQSILSYQNIPFVLGQCYRDKTLERQLKGKTVLHIRCGDYQFEPQNKASALRVLDVKYYINSLKSQIVPLDLIICSDDLDHAQRVVVAFSKEIPVRSWKIQCDDMLDHLYFYNADYLVCANSSFSLFFGLVSLHRKTTKQIIIPSHWFLSKDISRDYVQRFRNLVNVI